MAEILRMKEGPAVDPSEGWEGVPVGEPIPLRPLPEASEETRSPMTSPAAAAMACEAFPEVGPAQGHSGRLRLHGGGT